MPVVAEAELRTREDCELGFTDGRLTEEILLRTA